ncbi:NACHT domain-containing protein [Rickettsiales endosymbiont of Peranema trichophorum]|uniref:HEAT repeat domain-containing protein n=1 Tax=Rickettsiales endosymbiont of Peranema trichophorum TaxID=2486577 RepID=UPI0010239783|nr:HEAT repeat domain-containing protein [Rickettsiales endosymbiont of Peranema trichophorum]RZI46996.1 NACHT domain-containing protein [Rickettsiales endosymbiont of Peranema trichophorum]
MPAIDTRSISGAQDTTSTANEHKKYTLSEKLKWLYRSQDTLPKLIEDETFPDQKMDKYYVNLRIMLNSLGSGDKQAIEVQNLFEAVGDQAATGKVLITAIAGMGKSTLLKYISYKWGQEDPNKRLFGGKFDYVFSVKLKNLMANGWNKRSATKVDPLAKFIYEGLFEQLLEVQNSIEEKKQELEKLKGQKTERNEIQIAELETTINEREVKIDDMEISKDEVVRILKEGTRDAAVNKRILLLLDGYDEVAHLSHNTLIQRLLDEIWKFENVVLTTRPNSLAPRIENQFVRKIEGAGLGDNEVRQYIDRYFEHKENLPCLDGEVEHRNQMLRDAHQKLKEKYDSTPSLRETLSVPINTVIFCLVSGDVEGNSQFDEGIELPRSNRNDDTIGELYQKAVIWLGKRYARNKKDEQDVTQNRILSTDEFKLLNKVAYEHFVKNEVSISGASLDKAAIEGGFRGVRVGDIYKYGLLKAKKKIGALSDDMLLHQNYEFIHLSFQEWLTGYYLLDKLKQGGESRKEALQFISEVKTEPRYLVTLKLLVGLVMGSEEAIKEQFWNAVLSNADGMLELDVDSKVSLLMHLLGQVKEGNRYRIPHYKEVVAFIDGVVCTKLVDWGDEIRGSTYMSVKMKGRLFEVLEGGVKLQGALGTAEEQGSDVIVSQKGIELKSMIRLVGKVIAQLSSDEHTRVLDILEKLLLPKEEQEEGYWQVQGAILKVVPKVLENMEGGVRSARIGEFVNKEVMSFLRDENLKEATGVFFIELGTVKEVGAAAVKKLISLLKGGKVGYRDAWFVAEVIGNAVSGIHREARNEVFMQLIAILKDTGRVVALAIGKVADKVDKEVAKEALTQLIPLLKDEVVRSNAVLAIHCAACRVGVDHEVAKEIFMALVQLLGDEGDGPDGAIQLSEEERVRRAASRAIGDIASEADASQEALTQLIPLLSDEDENVRSAAARMIRKVANGADKEVAKECLMRLIYLLSDKDWRVRGAAAEVIGDVACRVGIDHEVVKEGFIALRRLLRDEDENVRQAAAKAIGDVACRVGIDHEVVKEGLIALRRLLRDEDENVRQAAAEGIGDIACRVGVDHEVVKEGFIALRRLLRDESKYIQQAAAKAIGDVACRVGVDHEVVKEGFMALMYLLKNEDESVRSATARAIAEVTSKVGLGKEVAKEALRRLIPLLSDECQYVREAAARAIGGTASRVEADKEVGQTVLRQLMLLLKDEYKYVREAAAEAIGQITSRVDKEVSKAVLRQLMLLLKDEYKYVREAAAEAIRQITSRVDKEVSKAVLRQLISLLENKNARYVTAETIGKIASRVDKEVANEALTQLTHLLKDSNTRIAAAEAIGNVACRVEPDEELAREILRQLMPLLQDKGRDVRQAAAEAIGQVAYRIDQDVGEEVLTQLMEFLKESASKDSANVIHAIGKVAYRVKVDKGAREAVLMGLIPLLKDKGKYPRKAVAWAICKVAVDQEVAKAALLQLIPLLKTENMHRSVVGAIFQIAQRVRVDKEVANEALEQFIPFLKDQDVAYTLGCVASGVEDREVRKQALMQLILLLKDKDSGTHGIAGKAIDAIICNSGFKTLLDLRETSRTDKITHDKIISALSTQLNDLGALEDIQIDELRSVQKALAPDFKGNKPVATSKGSEDILKSVLEQVLQRFDHYIGGTQNVHAASRLFNAIEEDDEREDSRDGLRDEIKRTLEVRLKSLDDYKGQSWKLVLPILEVIGQHPDEEEPKEAELVKIARKVLYEQIAKPGNAAKAIEALQEVGIDNVLRMSSESRNLLKKLYQSVLEDRVIEEKEAQFMEECMKHGITALFRRDGSVILNGIRYRVEDEKSKRLLEDVIEKTLDTLSKGEDSGELGYYVKLAKQYKTHQPMFTLGSATSDISSEDVKSILGSKAIVTNEGWHTSIMHLSTQGKTPPKDVLLLMEKRNVFGDHVIAKISVDSGGAFRKEMFIRDPRNGKTVKAGSNEVARMENIIDGMSYNAVAMLKPRYYVTSIELDMESGTRLLQYVSGKKIDVGVDVYNEFWSLLNQYGHVEVLNWLEYVKNADGTVYELKKEKLFEEKEVNYVLTRQESFEINMLEFNNLERQLQPILTSLHLKEEDEREVAEIESDPYKKGFYKALILQLNGVYAACLNINSELISAKEEKGHLGTFGGLVKSFGEGMSLFGVVGLSLIGDVMEKIDSTRQEESTSQRVQQYLKLASTSTKMERFAEKLSRELVKIAGAINLEEDSTDHIATALDIAGKEQADMVTSALLTVQGRIADVSSAKGAGELKSYTDYLKRFFSNGQVAKVSEQDQDMSRGEEEAKKVSKLVIQLILEGKLADIQVVDEQVSTVIELLGLKEPLHTVGTTPAPAVDAVTAGPVTVNDAAGTDECGSGDKDNMDDTVPNHKARKFVVEHAIDGRYGIMNQLEMIKGALPISDRGRMLSALLDGAEETVKAIKGALGEESRSEPQYNNAREKLFICSSITYRLPGTWDRLKYVLKEAIKDDEGESYLDIDSKLNTFDNVVSYWTGLEEVTSKIGNVVRPTLVLGGATASYITTNRHSELVWAMSQPEFGFAEGGMVQKSLYYLTSGMTAVYFGGLAAGAIGAATAAGTTGLMTAPVLVPASMALLAGSSLMGRASVDLGLVSEDNSWVYTLNTGAGLGMEVLGLFNAPSKILKAMHGIGITAYSVVPLQSAYSNLKSMCGTAYEGIFPPEGWLSSEQKAELLGYEKLLVYGLHNGEVKLLSDILGEIKEKGYKSVELLNTEDQKGQNWLQMVLSYKDINITKEMLVVLLSEYGPESVDAITGLVMEKAGDKFVLEELMKKAELFGVFIEKATKDVWKIGKGGIIDQLIEKKESQLIAKVLEHLSLLPETEGIVVDTLNTMLESGGRLIDLIRDTEGCKKQVEVYDGHYNRLIEESNIHSITNILKILEKDGVLEGNIEKLREKLQEMDKTSVCSDIESCQEKVEVYKGLKDVLLNGEKRLGEEMEVIVRGGELRVESLKMKEALASIGAELKGIVMSKKVMELGKELKAHAYQMYEGCGWFGSWKSKIISGDCKGQKGCIENEEFIRKVGELNGVVGKESVLRLPIPENGEYKLVEVMNCVEKEGNICFVESMGLRMLNEHTSSVIEISKKYSEITRTVKEISEIYCNNVESDKEGICHYDTSQHWIPVEELL